MKIAFFKASLALPLDDDEKQLCRGKELSGMYVRNWTRPETKTPFAAFTNSELPLTFQWALHQS
jgi:hypothetical protein